MIDTHTHTKFSFDGKDSAVDMAERGRELNLDYMAFTDHFDRDYVYIDKYSFVGQLDVKGYIEGVTNLKERYPFLALGIELGYSERAENDYNKLLDIKKFDYVLNSIHTIDSLDVYNSEYFEEKSKHKAYETYLLQVLKSTKAKFFYNTISHLGFARKNSNYQDNLMPLSDYRDIVDAIFKNIIDMGKTLEVNSNIKTSDFMPTSEYLKRYFELGGRSIAFASDAHVVGRIGEMYTEACDMVKDIGFRYWTVYRERNPVFIEIE